jgi:POT family proton-dependent oligopeptide transporter
MILVIVGNGFFKPNISTLLGNVYTTPQYIKQKDDGYNIFYMGINIGAFICNFFGAVLYNVYGWGAAFLAAGVGMFLGVIIFLAGTRHYREYDVKKGVSPGDMSMTRITMLILFPAVAAGVIGWIVPPMLLDGPLVGSSSTDAFLFACIPVIYFYTSLYFKAAPDERRPIAALLAIFAVVVMFWAVFKQNGSALNTWADRYTNREVSGTAGKIFEKLKFAQTVEYKKDSMAVYDEQFRLMKLEGAVVKEVNYPTPAG